MNLIVVEIIPQMNSAKLVFNVVSAMSQFTFSVGWNASQKTYLFASGQVNGLHSLHK